MVGTKVVLDQRLGNRLTILSAADIRPIEDEYRASKLIVVDGVEWAANLKLIRSALVKKHRRFKEQFTYGPISQGVEDETRKLAEQVNRIFLGLLPSFAPVRFAHQSLRNMITGPEPMHFDTYGGETKVAAFVNVSEVPRIYNVGPSFEQLVAEQPKVMQEVIKECEGNLDDLSYCIRGRTMESKPPIGKDCPRHRAELAPGSVWFFNPKTVSHEVVYGEGAAGFNWVIPPGLLPSQADLVAGLL